MYCTVVKNNLKTFWFSRPPTCHHTSQEKHRCHFGSCPPCHQPCQKVLEKCGHLCPASCHDQALVRQTGKVRTVAKSSCLPVGSVFFSDYLTSNHKGVFSIKHSTWIWGWRRQDLVFCLKKLGKAGILFNGGDLPSISKVLGSFSSTRRKMWGCD